MRSRLDGCPSIDALQYMSCYIVFMVQGAVMKSGPQEPYVLFSREYQLAPGKGEVYVPLATFDSNPDADQITPFFR